RRIIIGTFARMSGFRDAYYIKAAKVRTKIIDEYKQAFKDLDIIISPVTPTVAPKFEDIDKMTPLQNYMSDIMTVGPNLAGIPHMSFPIGNDKDGMPIGMMVMADHFNEKKLINLGYALENE
ncbi:MAG: amidase family protein, partial [Minisyncoccales bacterium]